MVACYDFWTATYLADYLVNIIHKLRCTVMISKILTALMFFLFCYLTVIIVKSYVLHFLCERYCMFSGSIAIEFFVFSAVL